MKYDECKSKLPSKSVNSVSVGSVRDVRKRNLKRIILDHLNNDSIRNKCGLLVDQIKGNVDIIVISETKLDESFPNVQFKIPGYALPYRLDCSQFGGGIMVSVKDYRKFSNDKFLENLISRLSAENIRVDCNSMEKVLQICIKTLDKLPPHKKNYYANLNEKDLTDNKQHWQTVKPLLSDKIKLSEKITLVEPRETLETDGNIDDEIVNDDIKIAEIFKRFFSNAVIGLKIPDFHGAVPLADNIFHPIFRAILKYANHPNTIAMKDLNNT